MLVQWWWSLRQANFVLDTSVLHLPQEIGQWGITTNSQNMILITDFDDHRIQILDQDGRFLRYIDSCCCLYSPMGLYVDSDDNVLQKSLQK